MDEENSLLQLAYASASPSQFSEKNLDDLLQQARQTNSQLNVTGVLLYRDQSFFQVLEGPANVVRPLYEKISRDPRHHDVLVIADREVSERNFGDWNMGFIRDEIAIQQLPGFVDFFNGRTFVDLHGDAARIKRVLDGFKRGRWHRGRTSVEA